MLTRFRKKKTPAAITEQPAPTIDPRKQIGQLFKELDETLPSPRIYRDYVANEDAYGTMNGWMLRAVDTYRGHGDMHVVASALYRPVDQLRWVHSKADGLLPLEPVVDALKLAVDIARDIRRQYSLRTEQSELIGALSRLGQNTAADDSVRQFEDRINEYKTEIADSLADLDMLVDRFEYAVSQAQKAADKMAALERVTQARARVAQLQSEPELDSDTWLLRYRATEGAKALTALTAELQRIDKVTAPMIDQAVSKA